LTLKVDMGMGDESFSGFVSVGKKVLFEVWDAKGMTSEFLGEVYINDLEECREMYEGSFPLQAATLESTKREKQIYKGYHLDPTTKVYKPPEAKDSRSSVSEWSAGMGGSKANLKEDNVQGELSISARWVFPEPVADFGPRPEGGAEREKYDEEVEKARNTGRLNLSIRRATGLKSRDAGVLSSRGETASPFVKIWVFNEEGKKWRLVGSTKTMKTTEPVWNEDFVIRMYSGKYEARMDKFGLAAAKRDAAIEIKFAPDNPQGHGVKVFETDTFADVIMKAQKAIETMSVKEKSGANSGGISQYDGITISPYRNIALGFVAPPQFSLRKDKMGSTMSEAAKIGIGREENRERQYARALGDELNWKPIGPDQTLKEVKDDLMDFSVQIANDKPVTKVHMRLIEHSKGYELTNPLYQEYKIEMREKQSKMTDSATDGFCWAPYKPHGPAAESPFYYAPGLCKGVAEWRRAECVPTPGVPSSMSLTWMVPSAGKLGGSPQFSTAGDPKGLPGDQPDVNEADCRQMGSVAVFKPEGPDFDPEVKIKREELYNEAVTFADNRVPIRQIVADLNRDLNTFYMMRKEQVWEETKLDAEGKPVTRTVEGRSMPKPKKITFENVQAKILQARAEKEKAAKNRRQE